ncbi:hypothetical protein EV122DRAFT_280143 [Schizophyllum commune]
MASSFFSSDFKLFTIPTTSGGTSRSMWTKPTAKSSEPTSLRRGLWATYNVEFGSFAALVECLASVPLKLSTEQSLRAAPHAPKRDHRQAPQGFLARAHQNNGERIENLDELGERLGKPFKVGFELDTLDHYFTKPDEDFDWPNEDFNRPDEVLINLLDIRVVFTIHKECLDRLAQTSINHKDSSVKIHETLSLPSDTLLYDSSSAIEVIACVAAGDIQTQYHGRCQHAGIHHSVGRHLLLLRCAARPVRRHRDPLGRRRRNIVEVSGESRFSAQQQSPEQVVYNHSVAIDVG